MNNIKKYELVKFVDDELEMDISVSPDEETIWMSLDQIGLLFDRDKSVISRHIKKIFTDNELDAKEVVAFFATTANDGKTYVVKYYNLDVIISIGYRVNSQKGTNFRRWSNHVLKEYLLKGYIINENRVIVSNDNYIELKNKVIDINNRLSKVEDLVLSKEHLLNKILYNGEFYDAYTLIQNIIESANSQIIIIDNYIDRTVLDRLVVKKEKVKVNIYTTNAKLLPNDIQTFNQQYG
ncbi:MAG: virulence RhuM family protein, partial [Bacilli bacterium]|nr:virulence RhuM family protein [Bacilli bacterium]